MQKVIGETQQVEKVGHDEGAWFLPSLSTIRPGLALLVGAGENIDLDLHLNRIGFETIIVDPTPRAVTFVKSKIKGLHNIQLIPKGISLIEGQEKFYHPKDSTHVSVSITNLQKTNEFIILPVTTIAKVLENFNNKDLQIIKLDIEGLAPKVIRQFLDQKIYPKVLLVDLEYPMSNLELIKLVIALRKQGYRLIKMNKRDCTFVRSAINAS